jgi:hypothetical protein
MPTAEQLQLDKLQHEVAKLQIELANLRSPLRTFWRTPASYFTLVTALVGVAAYMGQSYATEAKLQKSQAELVLGEIRKKEQAQEEEKLQAKRVLLAEDNRRLGAEYAELVQKRVAVRTEIEALQSELQAAQNELRSRGQASARLDGAVKKADELAKVAAVSPTKGLVARIYIQVATAQDKQEAAGPAAQLRADGRAVPDIEVVGDRARGLGQSELRYFWPEDEDEARAIAAKAREAGLVPGALAVKFPAHLRGKTRPRHFEIWLKPD